MLIPSFSSFVALYLALTVVFVAVLLFGENVAFQGTPVAWIHWFITRGFFDGLE
jgi:hypothetical protein